MTSAQWTEFKAFRASFKKQCDEWSRISGTADWLAKLQKAAADADENPVYPLETPIVYNRSLDSIVETDSIRLIVVGDNPGKDEQRTSNRRYLVGQAGKLGDGFFRRNPELGVDFRKNVIILNKTPIHTAKTKQLAYIRRNGGERFERLFQETQAWMAQETARMQAALDCELWLVGYGELGAKKLFSTYADSLAHIYRETDDKTRDQVRVYQHFSMNRFSIDLGDRSNPAKSLAENLRDIGLAHRREILGW
jgi:hypothetical protein